MTILNDLWEMIKNFALESGIAQFFTVDGGWKSAIMLAIAATIKGNLFMNSFLLLVLIGLLL